MRNFTNDAIFDDTLPIADGFLEAGYRVPLDRLQTSMEDWFRRKSYLAPGERLRITEAAARGLQPNSWQRRHVEDEAILHVALDDALVGFGHLSIEVSSMSETMPCSAQ